MTPAPSNDSILSKLIFVAIILVLVLVLAACALFIYNSLYPHTEADPVTITPTPVSTNVTVRPTLSPTKMASPTAYTSPYVNVPQDTRVSITSGVYSDLGIWDHYIVYDETVSDDNINVHLYNIDNKQDHVIARGNVHSYGTIGNGQVALLYPDTNVIKLYDIATGKTSQGSVNSNAARSSMVISGSYLLYCEDDGMMDPFTKTWDSVYCVYLFNMNDDTTSSIKSNIGKPIDIRMDGNYVVWTTLDGDGSDILLFDIHSNPLKVITIAQGGSNNHARISGNKVVYHSDKGDVHHIYIYDISTGQTVPMTDDSKQMSADIYGNTVVFDDYRDGNWNIYTYDMTTRLSHYFTYETHDQMSPVIYGNHVAYMDYRNPGLGVGESDIYTMDLS
jgi:beta propeller repeat protein